MWLMFFPLFGTWWWLITLAAILFIIIAEENDSSGGAFGLLLTYMIVITIFGEGVAVLKWIGSNPFLTFLSVIVYFLLGVPWARFWWQWKQSEKRKEYNDFRRTFLLQHGVITASDNHLEFEIPDEFLAEWNNGNSSYLTHLNKRTFWIQHKDTLICAMTWWPIHLGSFFFKDFISGVWKKMLVVFRAVFDRVDQKTWGDVESDFRKATHEQLNTYEQQQRQRGRY